MKSLSAIKDHRLIQFAGEHAKLTGNYFIVLFWAVILGGWIFLALAGILNESKIQSSFFFNDALSFSYRTILDSFLHYPLFFSFIWPSIILGYIVSVFFFYKEISSLRTWLLAIVLIYVLNGFWVESKENTLLFIPSLPTLMFYLASSVLMAFGMHSLTYAEDNNFIFRAKLFLIPAVLIFGINMALFFTL